MPAKHGRDEEVRAAAMSAWARLGQTGTWWTGSERVALARSTRAARDCPVCIDAKAAVSPYAVTGEHRDEDGVLPDVVIGAVHRVATDPARLTRRWHDELIAAGIGDELLVELIAVVATVTCVDTVSRALGLTEAALPDATGGAPRRERPADAVLDDAWVPTLPPQSATGELARHYARLASVPGIYRALSLVPDEQVAYMDLACAMYLAHEDLYDFSRGRSLSRPQLEVVSTTVSSLNDCHY